MQSSLESLSNELAKLVEEFQSDVVAVHARSHYPSSGVHWRPGIIVTADHTVRREEDIRVTLPTGKTVNATLAGRDSGTDIALLKAEGLGSPATQRGDPASAVGDGADIQHCRDLHVHHHQQTRVHRDCSWHQPWILPAANASMSITALAKPSRASCGRL